MNIDDMYKDAAEAAKSPDPLQSAIGAAFSEPEYARVARRFRGYLAYSPKSIDNFDPSAITLFEGSSDAEYDGWSGMSVEHFPYLLELAREARDLLWFRVALGAADAKQHQLHTRLAAHINRVTG